MDTCVCGRKLVCIKCNEIPVRCECENDVYDYSQVEVQPVSEMRNTKSEYLKYVSPIVLHQAPVSPIFSFGTAQIRV
jgi:hypothetical protein